MDTKISATIRPDQFAWIKRVKAETGVTITHIVRKALDTFIKTSKGKDARIR